MLLFICRAPGCGRTITHSGYCDKHKDLQVARTFGKPKVNYKHMYNNSRWRTLRLKILERDGGCCVQCGATENLHIDHINPHNGKEELFYNESNLQVLCNSCHGEKTFQESMNKTKRR